MTKKGLISCIIPVYNREALITQCIDSVFSQTYPHYEIIVVDDGSTDKTPQILSNLNEQYPEKIQVLNQTNQGPGAARQAGLSLASGEFIQFLDSDDLIKPEKFERFMDAFTGDQQPDIVYAATHYYEIGDQANFMVWKQTDQPFQSILPNFAVFRPWGTATPIYRHNLIKNAGKILPLTCEEDLEFECRIGLQNPILHHINQHLTDIRHHGGDRFSINNPNRAKQLSEQIIAREHIYNTLCEFGLSDDSSQMKYFSQTLFLFARQAADLGLKDASKRAFKLAQVSGKRLNAKDKLTMSVYKAMQYIAGVKTGSALFNAVYSKLHQLKQ